MDELDRKIKDLQRRLEYQEFMDTAELAERIFLKMHTGENYSYDQEKELVERSWNAAKLFRSKVHKEKIEMYENLKEKNE